MSHAHHAGVAEWGDVLAFWFGAPDSPEFGTTRPLWFTKSDATDAAIRERFLATHGAARRGDLDDWHGDPAAAPRAALAFVIVLDQFSRNLFRHSAEAFAGDAKALAAARKLVSSNGYGALQPVERWFAAMPFEHSEDRTMQELSLKLFARLADDGLAEPLKWAKQHAEIIERFGRFPHRNGVLGRASKPDEIEFLTQPGSTF